MLNYYMSRFRLHLANCQLIYLSSDDCLGCLNKPYILPGRLPDGTEVVLDGTTLLDGTGSGYSKERLRFSGLYGLFSNLSSLSETFF